MRSNQLSYPAFAFGNAVASDCALRNKGDACLRSPHRKHFIGLHRGPIYVWGQTRMQRYNNYFVYANFSR